MASKQPKKEPSLRERVDRLLEGLKRQAEKWRAYDNDMGRGKTEAFDAVIQLLETNKPYRSNQGRDKIRFILRKIDSLAAVPTEETATFDAAMYAGIAYKQLYLQVSMLLQALPDEEEEEVR